MTKYLRFGDIPENGKSKIWRGEECVGEEEGVSVYEIRLDKDKHISICLPFPFHRDTLDTLTALTKYDNRPCYIVTGEYVGKGTDGEPLISNVQIEEEFPKIISDEKMEQMGEEISKTAVDNIREQFNKTVEEEPEKIREIRACIGYALACIPNEKIKDFGVSLQDCLNYIAPVDKGLREPEKQTSEYFKKPNYDKQVVKKMSKELAKIITDQIVEPVDLEKAAEEYADKHGFRVPYDGSNNFYDDVDVKASLEGFKAGAKWMEAKEKEFKDIRDTTRWVNRSIGYQQGLAAAKLTWEDLQKLDIIAADFWQEGKYDKNDAQEFYSEVLKRFNEYKEQKNK